MKKILIKSGFTVLMGILLTSYLMGQQTGSFKDPRDGKVYKTVKIGEQTWFAENLAYKINPDPSGQEYDPAHVEKFGRLYIWEDALDACPAGWHLPSKEEFETLLQNVGGEGKEAYEQLIPGGGSGFSVLMGGWRNNNGADGNIGNYANFWSTSEAGPGRVWTLTVYGYGEKAVLYPSYLEYAYKTTHGEYFGFCVRCLKDD